MAEPAIAVAQPIADVRPLDTAAEGQGTDVSMSTELGTDAPAAALTPPTSEDNDVKLETQSSSDLSEIALDAEQHVEEAEEEEIVPDHYYDGGKIPVFKPTMEQFRSFKDYVQKIDKYGMKAGIVKVIPPPEWRESLPDIQELVKTIKIKNPIMQEFMGTHGIYTQANIEKQRSYNLPEWKSLTEETQYQPPARRGERRRGQEKIVRGGGSTRARASPKPPPPPPQPGVKRGRGRPRKHPLSTEAATEDATEPADHSEQAEDDTQSVRQSVEKPSPAPKQKKARGRQPKGDTQKSVTSRRMNNHVEKADVIDEAAFEGFDHRLHDLDEFTTERCKELETAYWKSLTFAQPMYAADMPGSLFTDDVTSWNVAKLENLLDVLGTKVPGVNTAYLYMGMWKATFAWHLEDVDLYSINYIHFGAPKQWYSISQEDARKFEAAMKNVWPNDSKNCDQFLRHKTYLISPQLLKERYNIQVNRLVHHEGEFVITYPYGYHSGYNLGYNCAESVNFALESWLDFGRIARKCNCEADSVWVDVAEIERKLRGEPTPEYYEETDDDDDEAMDDDGNLPTPPASVKGKSGRKRKRDTKDKSEEKPKKKKIKIMIKKTTREPCALCPHDAPHEPMLATDNGKKAHRSCALYTPETYLGIVDGVEIVLGIAGIDKARLGLKCNYCRSKRGSCFQCASKKCTRAFHASCAAAAGVQIDAGPVPTFSEDGTEYFEEGFDFRCKVHRPRRAKNLDPDTLETNKLINNYARKLQVQDVVQAQHLGGEIFAGLVVENRPSEMTVLIDILPEGDRVEVEWKWLVVLDPQDSKRPKPSPSALPVPPEMTKHQVSMDNRQDGVPTVDETFNGEESNKWGEFCNLTQPPQGYQQATITNKEQQKVDLDKPDQLYFYLGEISTEGRPRFTDDPAKRVHVLSSDYMERVKPPAPPRATTSNKKQQNGGASVPGPYSYKPKVPAPVQGFHAYQNSFPADAYYSTTRLPVAFPGQYSNYTNHVRQHSGGQASVRRPSLSGHLAHIAPRPPSMLHGHPNPANSGVLQPAVDLGGQTKSQTGHLSALHVTGGARSQGTSPGGGSDGGRDSNVEWTPPSQVYQSHGLDQADSFGRPSTLDRPALVSGALRNVHQQLAHQTQSPVHTPPQTIGGQQHIWSVGYVPHTFKQAPQPATGPMESPRAPTQSPLSEKELATEG